MLRLQEDTADFPWPWPYYSYLTRKTCNAREIRKDKIRVESVKGLTKQMITLVK